MTVRERGARSGSAIVYTALLVLGVLMTLSSFHYGVLREGGRVGPGFLPLIAGAGLTVFGAALLWCRRHRPAPPPGEEPDADSTDVFGRSEDQRVRMLWSVFGLALLALLAVPVLGLLVSLGAFTLVVSAWVERRPLSTSILITTVATIALHLVFGMFLGVPLPGGVLGLGTEG